MCSVVVRYKFVRFVPGVVCGSGLLFLVVWFSLLCWLFNCVYCGALVVCFVILFLGCMAAIGAVGLIAWLFMVLCLLILAFVVGVVLVRFRYVTVVVMVVSGLPSRGWLVLTSAGCLLWFAVCEAFGCFFIAVVLVFNSVAVYIVFVGYFWFLGCCVWYLYRVVGGCCGFGYW